MKEMFLQYIKDAKAYPSFFLYLKNISEEIYRFDSVITKTVTLCSSGTEKTFQQLDF